MKIGIIRHFKVDYNPKKIMNSDDFEMYIRVYDTTSIIENEVYLGSDKWDKCYCSDLLRAYTTASTIYKGNIEKTKLLREVQMHPVMKSKFKLPTFLWSISSRIAWKLNNESQLEGKDDTTKRAKEFLKSIDLNKNENILIVSHGFFLVTLINELKLLEFKGNVPKKIRNGTLYILEN